MQNLPAQQYLALLSAVERRLEDLRSDLAALRSGVGAPAVASEAVASAPAASASFAGTTTGPTARADEDAKVVNIDVEPETKNVTAPEASPALQTSGTSEVVMSAEQPTATASATAGPAPPADVPPVAAETSSREETEEEKQESSAMDETEDESTTEDEGVLEIAKVKETVDSLSGNLEVSSAVCRPACFRLLTSSCRA